MTQLNDAKRARLEGLGYSGSNSDMELAWLIDEVVSPNGLARKDLWYRYLIEQGIAAGQLNDMLLEWLGTFGYTGSLNDRWATYWSTVFLPSDLENLVLWTRFNQGITVTGAGVAVWADQSGEGNDLLQGTDTNRPSEESDGSILFDGVDNFLKTNAFTLNQPETVYLLARQITWASGDRVFDGNDTNLMTLFQTGVTPEIEPYAGSFMGKNSDWTLDTYMPVGVVYNGASSLSQVADNTPVTGNVGAGNAGGFTLGARGDGLGTFSNIQVKEVIIYSDAKGVDDRALLQAYLNSL